MYPALRIGAFNGLFESANRQSRWWLAFIALCFAVQISPLWYPKMDSCIYLSIARSMAHDETVTNLGSTRIIVVPGYSYLISPAFLVGDRPFLLLSLIHFVVALAGLAGVFVWARRNVPSAAVLVTGLVMLNCVVWIHHRPALKEMLCLTAMVWSVNLLQPLLRQPKWLPTLGLAASAGALMSAAVLVRYSTVALLPGFVLAAAWGIWRRECRWWYAMLVSFAVCLPPTLTLLSHIHHEEQPQQRQGGQTYAGTYTATVKESPKSHYLEGLRLQIASVGRITIPGMFKSHGPANDWTDINMLVYLPWMVIPLAGWWWIARRRGDVLAFALPVYIALYVPAACDQGCRFLVPMVPILMACTWVGLVVLFAARQQLLAFLTVAHFCVAVGYWVGVDAPRAIAANQQWSAIDDLAEEIDHDREATVLHGLERHEARSAQMLLTLALDRSIKSFDGSRPIPDWVTWVVTDADRPRPEGFQVAEVHGRMQLLRRTPVEAAPAAESQTHVALGEPAPNRR